jgi:hypothetical protein
VCKEWVTAQVNRRFLDALGVDYNISSQLVYKDLHRVPLHIQKEVIIDSLSLSDTIKIGDKLIETKSAEAQLFLSNLANQNPKAYREYISIHHKSMYLRHSELFEAQFNKDGEL